MIVGRAERYLHASFLIDRSFFHKSHHRSNESRGKPENCLFSCSGDIFRADFFRLSLGPKPLFFMSHPLTLMLTYAVNIVGVSSNESKGKAEFIRFIYACGIEKHTCDEDYRRFPAHIVAVAAWRWLWDFRDFPSRISSWRRDAMFVRWRWWRNEMKKICHCWMFPLGPSCDLMMISEDWWWKLLVLTFKNRNDQILVRIASLGSMVSLSRSPFSPFALLRW